MGCIHTKIHTEYLEGSRPIVHTIAQPPWGCRGWPNDPFFVFFRADRLCPATLNRPCPSSAGKCIPSPPLSPTSTLHTMRCVRCRRKGARELRYSINDQSSGYSLARDACDLVSPRALGHLGHPPPHDWLTLTWPFWPTLYVESRAEPLRSTE